MTSFSGRTRESSRADAERMGVPLCTKGWTKMLKRHGINYNTVAYEVEFPFTENPAWNGVEHMFTPVEFKGMTSIRPTLEARNDVVLRGQYVHNLSFPFVSPLETEQYVDFHWPCVRLQK